MVGPALDLRWQASQGWRRGANVMFSLVLQQRSVPPAAAEHSVMSALEGRYRASLSEAWCVSCSSLEAGSLVLRLTRPLHLSPGAWQCPCGGGSDWWCPLHLTHCRKPAADGDLQMYASLHSCTNPGLGEVSTVCQNVMFYKCSGSCCHLPAYRTYYWTCIIQNGICQGKGITNDSYFIT